MLLKQEIMGWQWHQLDHMQNHLQLAADRKPRQYVITQLFCRPDALPDDQPTVSKH